MINDNQPSTAPIEEKHRALMNGLAEGLDDILNGPKCPKDQKETGFFLFVFDFNKGPQEGRMNYISNADRVDVLAALKSMVAQTEAMLAKKQAEKEAAEKLNVGK